MRLIYFVIAQSLGFRSARFSALLPMTLLLFVYCLLRSSKRGLRIGFITPHISDLCCRFSGDRSIAKERKKRLSSIYILMGNFYCVSSTISCLP